LTLHAISSISSANSPCVRNRLRNEWGEGETKKGITDCLICNPFEIPGGGDRSRTDE
jgi:hypothetical protein